MSLSAAQPISVQAIYSDLKDRVMNEEQVFLGAPGTISERVNQGGHPFFVHMLSMPSGKRISQYLGSANDPEVAEKLESLRQRIDRAKSRIELIRLLANAGCSILDPKTYAVLASLSNAGLFRAGGILVGSHAYGVILADRGIRSAAYRTEDIDLAKGTSLAIAGAPLHLPLKTHLQSTDLKFTEVPGMAHNAPSVSLKEPGLGGLRVDILVPGQDESFRAVAVPELNFHATAIPHLSYLLEQAVTGLAVGRYGACLVNTPAAERFALHKLVTAADRRGRQDKVDKDIFQACVLLEALSKSDFGGVLMAKDEMPSTMHELFAKGLAMARRMYASALSEEDWGLLADV
jgi:hypothetical protein